MPKNASSPSKIIITDKDIKHTIDEMVIILTPGPDNITADIYTEFSDQLSLKKEKLPEGIAQATIRPIYKGGVKSNPANC